MDGDEEECVFYGTPLPEVEDEATLRKKAAKELQVRDEKGRQRFHGAFTGGFSAGYFNTVGTKEGWAPSTFVSSRNKVAEHIQQNPEDFMDDEDFGDFGIATRKIHTTSNFQAASDTNSRKRQYVPTDVAIPGEAPLIDIVQPVRESIGILILNKLGWRQGQGIGPRVKKQNSGMKVYGCSPFPNAVEPEEDDPFSDAFTFAPEDTEEIFYKPKDNYFGLGYSGLSKQSVLTARFDEFAPTSTKSWLAKDKKKLTISGQAFGVGAYEDDDADIYAKDDMSQYDFSDLAVRGSEDSPKTTDSKGKTNTRGIIEGFHLASQPHAVKKHYAPPELPRNFNPVHLKSTGRHSENMNPDKSRHALSASGRSLILGEKKFLKVPSNVTTLQQVKSSVDLKEDIGPSSSVSPNFQPFPNDKSKQQRYEEYLKLKKGGDVRKIIQPSSMTEWEKQQELEEFSKAAVLFQPLSNVLKSRFESRSHLSVEHEVMSALEKIKKENEEKKTAAVKRNLIGTSNRKTVEWHPDSLLCKRLNVPNPYPNSSTSSTQNSQKTKSVFDHLSLEKSRKEKDDDPVESNNASEAPRGAYKEMSLKALQSSDITIAHAENNESASSENKRPPIDFFKDIFENSSSDEESSQTEDTTIKLDEIDSNSKSVTFKSDNDVSQTHSISLQNEVEINKMHVSGLRHSDPQNLSSRNKNVGFGVFANLDLDALNQRPAKILHRKTLVSENDTNEISLSSNLNEDNSVQNQSKSEDMYGPELPPNYSCELSSNDAYSVQQKKYVKHKSKHKHHKHKHKKKKKKKSKKESSDSDSDSELEDIPPALIIEKLKKLQKKN